MSFVSRALPAGVTEHQQCLLTNQCHDRAIKTSSRPAGASDRRHATRIVSSFSSSLSSRTTAHCRLLRRRVMPVIEYRRRATATAAVSRNTARSDEHVKPRGRDRTGERSRHADSKQASTALYYYWSARGTAYSDLSLFLSALFYIQSLSAVHLRPVQ